MDLSIRNATELIRNTDKLLITASNGLSISEGYHIFADNEDFREYFGDSREKYGIDSIIKGVFARLPKSEHDRFMSVVRQYMIEDYKPSESFKALHEIAACKDYFIVTSNADTHFQLCGFDSKRIFEIEGNFDGMEMYSPDWKIQQIHFEEYLKRTSAEELIVLELGIGKANQMIKKPIMEMVSKNPKWKYITFNMPGEILIPSNIEDRSVALEGDIKNNLKELVKELKK